MITLDAKFVGIDTTRRIIEASVRPSGEFWTAEACEKGMTEISEKLSQATPELVVMQATATSSCRWLEFWQRLGCLLH